MFDCLISKFTAENWKYNEYPNYVILYLQGEITGDRYYFGKDGLWAELTNQNNTVTIVAKGTWECDGDSEFKITNKTKNLLYSSKTNQKTPIENDSTTTVEPREINKEIFPLIKGKRGPEVVQLQRFLNKQVPDDLLVVDGIFGEKTHNKLVKYQKDNRYV